MDLSRKTEALLEAAARAEANKPKGLALDDVEAVALAREWLHVLWEFEDAEKSLAELRGKLLAIVAPWHSKQCAALPAPEPTVWLDTKDGEVKVTFQHRYKDIPAGQEAELRDLVGDDYERFFAKAYGIEVRKEIAKDPAQLDAMVAALAKAIGPEKFKAWFIVGRTLAPTKEFTAAKYGFKAALAQKLEKAGVKQTVTVAAA